MAGYTSGSLKQGDLEIGIALVLQDRFSNQAREASSNIRQLHRDAKMAVNANLQAAQSIGIVADNIGTAMYSALKQSVYEGSAFIDMMTTVGAITEATDKQFKQLSDTAQTLGLKTMFNSQDIASGMKYLAMAGNSAKDINDMIYGAAYVAGATGMELGGKGGAADIITNVMRTFAMEGENASKVVGDQLAKAALSSNISMTDLAETIKYAGADMVTLGQTLPQVAAMAGTLGNAGIQASMAGTAISNMARYLNKSIADPNFKGGKMLEKLGLGPKDFVNSNGEIIDMGLALEKIKDAMTGMPAFERAAILNAIFGVRGMRAGVAMMNNLDNYRELLDKIVYESNGYAQEVMEKRMSSLAGHLDAFLNSLENLRTTFATSIEPILKPILKTASAIFGVIRDILALPVVGPLLAGLTGLGVILFKVSSAIIMFKAKWKLAMGDSQVSFKAMIDLMIKGWGAASVSASQYANIERTIIAQRKAGIAGSKWDILSKGGVVNGVGVNKAGRFYDTKTGRLLKTSTAASMVNKRTGAIGWVKSILGSAVGAGAASTAGKAAGSAASKLGTRALLGFGAKGLARGAAMLFGGPVGWAITGLSIAVPLLVKALNKNQASTDENTASVYTLAGKYATESERLKAGKDLTLTEEVRSMYQAMMYWANQLPKIKPTAVINLSVDGKGLVKQVIAEDGEDVNMALGTK